MAIGVLHGGRRSHHDPESHVTTRIQVQAPSASGEAARALQAANRRRLEQREEDDRASREAARRIRQRVTRSRADRDRAVPEFEPIEPVFAKRFGKAFQTAAAWWRYEVQPVSQFRTDHAIIVTTGDRTHEVRVDLPQIQLFSSAADPLPGSDRSGLRWWLCLPAGKDRMVLIFYAQVITATATPVGTTMPVLVFPPDPDDPAFPPNPGPGDTFEYVVEDTATIQYSSPVANAVIKAVVVSPSGINVMDCPSQLQALLSSRFTYLSGASVNDTYVNLGTRRIGYYVTEETIDGTYAWFEIAFEYESIPRLLSTIVTTYANDNRWERDRFVWLYLLRAYGYGRLVDRDRLAVGYEQDPGWGWTPAIYSYIKNYEGEYHVNDDDPSLSEFRTNAANYKYIRERYFPTDAPPFLLTSGFQTEEATAQGIDTSADYWYFRAPSASTASAISTADFSVQALAETGSQLRRNGGPMKKEPITSDRAIGLNTLNISPSIQDGALAIWESYDEIPVVAWDWGRPLACWLQLSGLGFTPSDLMLNDEEAEALAAADPATAGFKF